jgi:hypothetical protein
MRKERMIPMLFLAVLLVAATTLPQGFATTIPKLHPKGYTSHQVPVHPAIVQPAPNSTMPKASSQQSVSNLLTHGAELFGNQVLELKEGPAFAMSLMNV